MTMPTDTNTPDQSRTPEISPVGRIVGFDPSTGSFKLETTPHGAKIPSREHNKARLDVLAGECDHAEKIKADVMLIATRDVRALIDRSRRLEEVEAALTASEEVRKHLEARIAAGPEEFDITARRDVRQDALLAVLVLSRFSDDGAPFTDGDARQVRGAIRRLLADRDEKAESAGGWKRNRDDLALKLNAVEAGSAALRTRLADMTTNRNALDEACQRKDTRINDLTAERDAAAENARRERDQHAETVRSLDWVQEAFERREIDITRWGTARGVVARLWVEDLKACLERERSRRGTYSDTDLAFIGERLFQFACTAGTAKLTDKGEDGERIRPAYVEFILREAGLRTEREERPRCRVVTSPRFYSEEQREEARRALSVVRWDHPSEAQGTIVDTVAEALGMRRAK